MIAKKMEKTPVSGLHLQTKGNHGIRQETHPAMNDVYGSDGGPFQSSFEADDHHCLVGIRQDEGQPTTSAAARREDWVTNPGRRTKTKRLSMCDKLAMEFNERKLMYLKEEHDMKMQIINVELAMKEEERNRKQQQYQCSSRTSTSSGSRYFHL
ncbi:hypothetical protein J4Q44_G00201890 [Coregonus suidteri]|uniref:Uncharacterized protein n=1 Tax=Coregonus suidteri TaxID=861788 RepID=A0AAN8LRE0_9TELE